MRLGPSLRTKNLLEPALAFRASLQSAGSHGYEGSWEVPCRAPHYLRIKNLIEKNVDNEMEPGMKRGLCGE